MPVETRLGGLWLIGMLGTAWAMLRVAGSARRTDPPRGEPSAEASAEPSASETEAAYVMPRRMGRKPGQGDLRRARPRRSGHAQPVLVAGREDASPPRRAWVIERSGGGIRLVCETGLEVGRQYGLRPVEAPPSQRWLVIEIRHGGERSGHWEGGAAFVRGPTQAQLRLLG